MRSIIYLLLTLAFIGCKSKANFGKVVTDKGHSLYYLEPVTEQEAKNVLNWMHEINHNFGEPPVPFQLSKQANKYLFKFPVQVEGAESSEDNMVYVRNFANGVSRTLNNQPVDVILTTEDLSVSKRVVSSGGEGE